MILHQRSRRKDGPKKLIVRVEERDQAPEHVKGVDLEKKNGKKEREK